MTENEKRKKKNSLQVLHFIATIPKMSIKNPQTNTKNMKVLTEECVFL